MSEFKLDGVIFDKETLTIRVTNIEMLVINRVLLTDTNGNTRTCANGC